MTALHDQITQKIVSAIENGVNPFNPIQYKNNANIWNNCNGVTGLAYTGLNTLILAIAMTEGNYEQNVWVTFNQAKSAGLTVRKGEKGTCLTFYSRSEKKEAESDKPKSYFFLKSFYVFNVAQLDGDISVLKNARAITSITVDEVMKNSPVEVRTGYLIPCYCPSTDHIEMPSLDRYSSEMAYTVSLVHENVHATGAKHRLNRLEYGTKFGDESYAFEELVAELGACFLCNSLGLPPFFERHENYLNHWLKVLKQDSKAIFKASTFAQQAHDYILNGWSNEKPKAPVNDEAMITQKVA